MLTTYSSLVSHPFEAASVCSYCRYSHLLLKFSTRVKNIWAMSVFQSSFHFIDRNELV